jgi:hypothetical protein
MYVRCLLELMNYSKIILSSSIFFLSIRIQWKIEIASCKWGGPFISTVQAGRGVSGILLIMYPYPLPASAPWTASAWTPLDKDFSNCFEKLQLRILALDICHSICPVAQLLPWESRREIVRKPGRTLCNPESKCLLTPVGFARSSPDLRRLIRFSRAAHPNLL